MEEQRKQQKKTDIKKVFGGVLALVLVAVVSIVGTLAYLGDTTTLKENTFTGSEDISVELSETDWDKTNGGETKAKRYTPGLVIEKNPVITNNTPSTDTTGDYSEWVAMRVDYSVERSITVPVALTKVSYSDFTNATSGVVSSFNNFQVYSTTNTGYNWIKISPISGSNATFDIFVYKTKLAKEASTDALFESVTVNKSILKIGTSPNQRYPQFKIDVLGAAIKNETEFGTMSSLTISNLTYTDSSVKSSKDYIIMNELVKLLTTTDDYKSFTGLNTDGTSASS